MGDRKECNYAVACVNEFSRQKNLSAKESYLYLANFKGIEFLKEFYDVEHLLSFEDVVEDRLEIFFYDSARCASVTFVWKACEEDKGLGNRQYFCFFVEVRKESAPCR